LRFQWYSQTSSVKYLEWHILWHGYSVSATPGLQVERALGLHMHAPPLQTSIPPRTLQLCVMQQARPAREHRPASDLRCAWISALLPSGHDKFLAPVSSNVSSNVLFRASMCNASSRLVPSFVHSFVIDPSLIRSSVIISYRPLAAHHTAIESITPLPRASLLHISRGCLCVCVLASRRLVYVHHHRLCRRPSIVSYQRQCSRTSNSTDATSLLIN
jgi:hypothetical protein